MSTLTSGDVAKICKVAPKTARKFMDSNELKGWHVLGSVDRRTNWQHLKKFMIEQGMQDLIPIFAVLITKDNALKSVFQKRFRRGSGVELLLGQSNFDAGLVTAEYEPSLYVIDFSIGLQYALALCIDIRKNSSTKDSTILALLPNHLPAFDRSTLSEVFHEPFDINLLINRFQSRVSAPAHALV